jgi:hypothetical protein
LYSDIDSSPSFVLFFNEPMNDLIAVEDEPSAPARPEMRQALAKAPLADGPHGASDEPRDLRYRERLA